MRYFSSVWLTSLSMTFSRPTHVAANDIIFNNWVIFHCIYVMFNLLFDVCSRGAGGVCWSQSRKCASKDQDVRLLLKFHGDLEPERRASQCDGGQSRSQVLHRSRLQTSSCSHLFPRLVTASLSIYTENSGKDWKPHQSVLLFLIFTLC